jgi:hypothetical protein
MSSALNARERDAFYCGGTNRHAGYPLNDPHTRYRP